MEDPDRVDDQHRRLGEGSRLAQLAGVPVQPSDLDRAACAERLEDLGTEALALDAVPVARTPVNTRRIEEVVSAEADRVGDRLDDLMGQHGLAGAGVPGDAHDDPAALDTESLDGGHDVSDIGHDSRV